MSNKARPCFSGDGVARIESNHVPENERVIQFGRVLRAPKRHGRVFNAHSELTEKDIAWSPNHIRISSVATSNDVFLLERPVQKGSLIKANGKIGEVLNVDTRATVIHDEFIFKNVSIGDLNEFPEISGVLNKGMAVLLDNHVGRIESITQQISFRLPEAHSGYFLVEQDDSSAKVLLGDSIQLTEEQSKTTMWDTETGMIPADQDLSSPATVFRIEAVAAQISWEAHAPTDDNSLKPNSVIEGKSVGRLRVLRNTPARIREYFHCQMGSNLILSVRAGHHIEKMETWSLNMLGKMLLDDAHPCVQRELDSAFTQNAQAGQVRGVGQKLVVQPLYLQSQLTVRWIDTEGETSAIDSTHVDEVIAGPEATFVARTNTDYKDASYGIVFNCKPDMIAAEGNKQVKVLWFVDLKNDRLDPAVRVLRLQQEEICTKDLIILNDMQRLLDPTEIIMRKDASDEFVAGQSTCITSDGRIELVDFNGTKHMRWPTLLTPCISNVRTSVGSCDSSRSSDDANVYAGVDWTEIYYDAITDLQLEDECFANNDTIGT